LIKLLLQRSIRDLLCRMAEPYPIELRTRVVATYAAGEGSYAVLAGQFAVGSATVKRWVRQHRREGHGHPKPKADGTRSPVHGGDLDTLIIVLADPTAGDLTAAYNRARRGRQRVHLRCSDLCRRRVSSHQACLASA
jgi:transposase-like protein